MGKTIDIVVSHRNKQRIESEKHVKVDGECQTELNEKVIDFMAQGSQRYERVIKYGLIKENELNKVNLDILEAEEYYTKLLEQQLKDAMNFYHRKKFVIKGIQNYQTDIEE